LKYRLAPGGAARDGAVGARRTALQV